MENPDIITPDMTITEIREEKRRIKREELRKSLKNCKEVETPQQEKKNVVEDKEEFSYEKMRKLRGIPLVNYVKRYVDESITEEIIIIDGNGKKHTFSNLCFIEEKDGIVFYTDEIMKG